MNEPRWLTEEELHSLPEEDTSDLKFEDDPIVKHGDEFYFWDETWSQIYGPFDGYDDASRACFDYARSL